MTNPSYNRCSKCKQNKSDVNWDTGLCKECKKMEDKIDAEWERAGKHYGKNTKELIENSANSKQ